MGRVKVGRHSNIEEVKMGQNPQQKKKKPLVLPKDKQKKPGDHNMFEPEGDDDTLPSWGGGMQSSGGYSDYPSYGMNPPSPYGYAHAPYNYQMHQTPISGQSYPMYPPTYHPMQQRMPAKQYPYPPPYNYQDRGGYGQHVPPVKGVSASPHPYYEEYNYGDSDIPMMRGGHNNDGQGDYNPMKGAELGGRPETKQPTQQPRGAKQQGQTSQQQPQQQSQTPGASYSSYQYGHPISSMNYGSIHQGPYDQRMPPYDYNNQYKSAKPGDQSLQQLPSQSYNAKNLPIPAAYAYGNAVGNKQPNSKPTPDEFGSGGDRKEGSAGNKQVFREDAQGAGLKNGGKKKPMKPGPMKSKPESVDPQNKSKVGKPKQFAEDLSKNIENSEDNNMS